MNKSVVTALKVVLGAVMTALLAAQVWLSPVTAGEMANQYPEFASLKIPLLVLLEVALLCVQAFLVCLWVLLGKVAAGKIFDPVSLSWVRFMTLPPAGVACASFVALFFIPGPPLLMLSALLVVIICVGLVLLLIVMRGLLLQAVTDRAELEVVI
ncbi:DUF2975 domain-containing protein [Actinomycetaceae bacterium L2_0104]